MDAFQSAVMLPTVEVVVQRAARRKTLGDRGPLAAGAQDTHRTADHLAHIDRPLVAAALRGRDQPDHQRPFFVGQVTRVAQLAPVMPATALVRPHRQASARHGANDQTTTNIKHSKCFRIDTETLF